MAGSGGSGHSAIASERRMLVGTCWSVLNREDPEVDVHGGLSVFRNRSLVQVLLDGSRWVVSGMSALKRERYEAALPTYRSALAPRTPTCLYG